MTKAIVAVLDAAVGGPSDGCVPGRTIAAAAHMDPERRFVRASLFRRRGALDRLMHCGLVESRAATAIDPGPWRREYRAGLPWLTPGGPGRLQHHEGGAGAL